MENNNNIQSPTSQDDLPRYADYSIPYNQLSREEQSMRSQDHAARLTGRVDWGRAADWDIPYSELTAEEQQKRTVLVSLYDQQQQQAYSSFKKLFESSFTKLFEFSKNPDEATLVTNFDTDDLPLYQKCVELYQKQYKDCPFSIKQEAYDCRGNLLHSSMSLHIDSHSNRTARQQFTAIYDQEHQKFRAAQSKIAKMLYEKAQRNLPSQFEVRLYDNNFSGHYLYVHRHFSDLEAGVTFTPSYEDQPVKVMFWEGENVLSRQEFTDITQANSRAKQALQDIVAAVKDDKKIPDRTLSHDEH